MGKKISIQLIEVKLSTRCNLNSCQCSWLLREAVCKELHQQEMVKLDRRHPEPLPLLQAHTAHQPPLNTVNIPSQAQGFTPYLVKGNVTISYLGTFTHMNTNTICQACNWFITSLYPNMRPAFQ